MYSIITIISRILFIINKIKIIYINKITLTITLKATTTINNSLYKKINLNKTIWIWICQINIHLVKVEIILQIIIFKEIVIIILIIWILIDKIINFQITTYLTLVIIDSYHSNLNHLNNNNKHTAILILILLFKTHHKLDSILIMEVEIV